MKSINDVKRILVIGTGMMGPGIALSLARAGFELEVYGRNSASLERGKAGVALNCDRLVQYEFATPAELEAAKARIRFVDDLPKAAGKADMIFESIVEEVPAKHELYRQVCALCPADTILATNTSGLPITKLAVAATHPERFVGTHYWNPPYLMPLVEVIKGDHTAIETLETACQIIVRSGKRPIRVMKDMPGFLGNRLQSALQREAVSLAEKGVASPADIDMMIKYSFAMRMPPIGVFEYMDMVGLDLARNVQSYLWADLDDSKAPLPIVNRLIEKGCLGAKTGQGFFTWTPEQAEERKRKRDEEVARQLRLAKENDL